MTDMTALSVVTALAFFLMPAPTVLYDTNLVPVVTLPAGYFVLQNGDAPDGYLSVVYDDIRGLVRLDAVREVDYKPLNKYETTASFVCANDGQPVNLRARPQRSAPVVAVLDGASGHVYGTLEGDALIKNGGTVWYYVRCGEARGYCYYAHIEADAAPPNIIEKEPEEEPQPQPDAPGRGMSTAAAIIFTVALCIPVPFIIFYMFRKKPA